MSKPEEEVVILLCSIKELYRLRQVGRMRVRAVDGRGQPRHKEEGLGLLEMYLAIPAACV